MATSETEAANGSPSIGDRFPALRGLEEDVERAKLAQALAEAQAARITAMLPEGQPTFGTDSVTTSDNMTGLATVLAQNCALRLSWDVAAIVLDAARARTAAADGRRHYRFVITEDPSLIPAIDTLALLRRQARALRTRIAQYASAVQPDRPEPGGNDGGGGGKEGQPPPDDRRRGIAPPIAAAVITGLVQAAGWATNALRKSYEVSGAAVAVADLALAPVLAEDLRRRSERDEEVTVRLARFSPTGDAAIIATVLELAESGERTLPLASARAKAALAAATAAEKSVHDEIATLDQRILELTKKGDDVAALEKKRSEGAAQLPQLARAGAAAQALVEEGASLASDLAGFLEECVTPAATGTAPLMAAAAAEQTMPEGAGGVFLLHARLLAGGLDRTIETRLGPDRWMTLAGASAEYCCLTAEGDVVTSGVRTALRSTSAHLTDPSSLRRGPFADPAYERQSRDGTGLRHAGTSTTS